MMTEVRIPITLPGNRKEDEKSTEFLKCSMCVCAHCEYTDLLKVNVHSVVHS